MRRAAANGVDVLALTDHDELGGLAEAAAAAREAGIDFVPGVEISITWERTTIHIVGLGVDAADASLAQNLEHVRSSRARRAEQMAAQFDAIGIPGTLAGAYSYADNPSAISRTHFARFLVERGVAPDITTVFKHYLVSGKPGYVSHKWAELADAVQWIRASGGRSVVAHPGRYRVSRPDLRRFLAEFQALGGEGIEVITGSHTPEQYGEYARVAREFGFLRFPRLRFSWTDRKSCRSRPPSSLPAELKPVWHDWRFAS